MRIIFATNNKHKLEEVQHILGERFVLSTPGEVGITEDIPEDSGTIQGNASQKSNYIYSRTKINCFADDTGLEVEALNGEPGVYSARYAGDAKDSNANIDLLLKNLADKENRNAQFRTVISLIINGKEFLFEGIVKGRIIDTKRGEKGFGYDPVFVPDGYDRTFAELDMYEKNKISHRGIAISKLEGFLKTLENETL